MKKTIIETTSKYRTEAVTSPSYDLIIVIDNKTDVYFEDSIFAWTLSQEPFGGQAAGYKWLPNQKHWITSPSGGCVQAIGGSLFVGDQRLILAEYPAPPAGYCRKEVGWEISYGVSGLVASPSSVSFRS